MDELNEQAAASPAKKRRRDLLIAVIALVVLIAASAVSYHFLVGQVESGSGVVVERSSSQGSDGDLPLLATYNAVVATTYGEEYSFTEIADNRPLVVNFWATWCPYCVQEMGDLQMLYDEYGDRVSFALVDCVDGTRETLEDGSAWLDSKGITIPAYYDTQGDAQSKYGIMNLPTTVVANAQGEILTISPGVVSIEKMRDGLDSLLAG